jgi:hypothetical protein
VAGICGAIAVWSSTRPDSSARVSSPRSAAENTYVGDAACARCHSGEAFRHARSGHARTLVATRESKAARSLDGKTFHDPERGVSFHYRMTPDGLTVTLPERTGADPFPLDWAFGSGEHAVTFLTLIPSRAGDTVGIEHRVSLFAPDDHPGLTPNHSGSEVTQSVEEFGRVRRGGILTGCIGCHTTTADIADDSLTNLQANVGCERCHGPGGSHIRAVEEKQTDLAILFGKGRSSAEEEIRMCGQCHRHPESLHESKVAPDNPRLVRFQPVGLMQSDCYLKSSGRMRCIQCHAPDRSRTVPCPVSPEQNCVLCHMPQVEVRPGTKFHDHWIRVRKDDPESSKKVSPDSAPVNRK